MFELIKELFETYTHLHDADNSQIICIEDFAQAIQKACKAQRNACARIYNKHYGDSEHYDECCGLEIFTAEIRKEDYENISD